MTALNCNGHLIIYALGDCIHENMELKNEACGSWFNDTEPVARRYVRGTNKSVSRVSRKMLPSSACFCKDVVDAKSAKSRFVTLICI